MATIFNPMIVTNRGLEAYAAYLNGESLSITGIKIGSGNYTDEEKTKEALQSMTAMKSVKNRYDIASSELSATAMKLQAVIRNYDPDTQQTIIDEQYNMNEIGLFARVNNGNEFLFAIAVCSGASGDAISVYTGSNPIQIIQNITLQVDNAENVTVVIAPGSLAENISYDNSNSGMTATNIQAAIDEIAESSTGGGSVLDIYTSEPDFIAKTVTALIDNKTYTGEINENGRLKLLVPETGLITVSLTDNGTTYSVPVTANYFGNYNVILAKGELVTVDVSVDDMAAFDTTEVTCVDETDGTKTQTATMGATRQMFVVAAGHDYHIEYGELGAYTTPPATDTVTAGTASHAEYRATYRYSMEQIAVTLSSDDSLDVSALTVTLHNLTDDTDETKTCVNGRTSFRVLNGKRYHIHAEFVDQHIMPQTEVFTAAKGVVRNINLQYIASQALSACSWATIKSIIQAGTYASVWEVGDTKLIKLTTGEECELVIAGFNRDTISGSSAKAPITFTFTHSRLNPDKMNDTNTNVGGWKNSYMRGTVMQQFYNELPAELKAMVVSVDKLSDNGSSAYTIQTTSDKLFLFSEEEIFGSAVYGKVGQGTQYPLFATAANRIAKMGIGGSAYGWWERSSYASNAAYFCFVTSAGAAGNSSATYAIGVRPGFCISA